MAPSKGDDEERERFWNNLDKVVDRGISCGCRSGGMSLEFREKVVREGR